MGILKKSFFIRPTLEVAEHILGKYLVVRQKNGSTNARMITEVEAYDGFQDKASHASRGKTARNAPMFEAGGIWYVYFIYGMYDMLNIVTGPNDYPAAVLIRGVEGSMGPGKLTKQLGITCEYNGMEASRQSGLWVEDRGVLVSKKQMCRLPRVGVEYAGPVWAKKRYRFFIFNNV